ncbi:molybdate ABC transporter substrate-binding protein [Derxia lacustris]|uniref:molybdate ABC transporter substrate-binding protein n=1 Tax=Derxia lacustris TaxID=764842 RepID=UPI001593F314|nr:molybdate ABC transporter substrate-binding protein [Derxia lacustris]
MTINVAVAANFVDTLNNLITAYGSAGYTYSGANFTITSGATATLASNISTALNASNPTPYDLFFAADDTTPAALDASYTAVQTPWFYAQGKLVLWSKNGPNVTSGLGTITGYSAGQIAIANPSTAPYGKAAQEVLSRLHSITYPGGSYDAKFTQYTTIGTTYTAVNTSSPGGTASLGFVAKSQLCNGTSGAYKTGLAGTWHEYSPTTTVGGNDHEKILQHAVAITGRPGANASAVTDFSNFVTSTAGKAIIANWCYLTTP